MKVWFRATSLKIEEYINYYREIRNYLVKSNLVVVFDWIDDAYDYKVENPSGSRNIKNLFKKVTNAIDEADISVIEYTVPNFSSSHQIMYSILKRKLTVVLDKKQKYYLDWASSKRGKSRSEMIREAIDRIVEKDEEYKKYISKI